MNRCVRKYLNRDKPTIPVPNHTPYFLSEEDFAEVFEDNKVTINGQELATISQWDNGPAMAFDRSRKLFSIEGARVSPLTLAQSVEMAADHTADDDQWSADLRAEWYDHIFHALEVGAEQAPVKA
jgi:hypothetical protein